jgi:hypothetical protein
MRAGRSGPRKRYFVCAIATIALAASLALAPAATADFSFCPPGSGAGQCEKPEGVAVDTETGHVYVADRGNNRVDVFKADGTFLLAFGWGVEDGSQELQSCTSSCLKGISGAGAGELDRPSQIAVDNDPASASQHDVYLAEDFNHRVQKFDPEGHFLLAFGSEGGALGQFNELGGIGVASAGAVYVVDTQNEGGCKIAGIGGSEFKKRVQVFDESGSPLEALEPTDAPCGSVSGFVVDSSGDFYLANEGGSNAIRKYGPTAEALCEVDSLVETTALAIDPSGRLFSAQGESRARGIGAGFTQITQYDSACHHLRRFGYGVIGSVQGLAAPELVAGGDVFASEGGKGIHYLTLPPPGPIIASVEAGPVSNTKATLAAEINPEGKASEYRFEYVDEQSFQTEGGFASPNTKSTAAAPVPVDLLEKDPDMFKLHAVETLAGCKDPAKEAVEGKCLAPETTYRFRAIAENADGEGNSPLEGAFTTKSVIEFGEFWSTAVGVDTATLHGEVNPLGIPTTGYFEYVDDATFKESGFEEAIEVPNVAEGEAPIDFGEGEELLARAVSLSPLVPGTTYHYRLVAENPLLAEPLTAPAHTFTTFAAKPVESCPANEAFRIGPSASMPDCRADEMVSPLEKSNGDILVLKESVSGLPAVLNQSAVSGSRLAYGSYRSFGDAKSAPYTSQYLSARGAAGWRSHTITPPHGRLLFHSVFAYTDTEFKVFSPELCQAWLRTTAEPPLAPGALAGYPNLYRREDDECGGPGFEALSTAEPANIASGDEHYLELELQGVSADESHAIYVAPDNLVGSGAPNLGGNRPQLYVWAGGPGPVFACYLPGGKAWKGSCSGGTYEGGGANSRSANVQGAISADGQRVFWTAFSGSGPGEIYLREHPEQGQVAGECSEAAKPCTIAVSEAAEALSGTSASRFLAAASDGSAAIFATGEDLYEFDVDAETTTLIAHHALPGDINLSGILGASEDASRVYFASTEALGGQNSEGEVAVADQPNLYLWKEGSIRFIATLSGQDVPDNSASRLLSPISREPRFHLARVSPDGDHATFMSTAPLTGYDNTDANSGEADTEVFLYDAAANEGAGKLICASCNPSGARPAGANIAGEVVQFWAAAQIPVPENTLYAARVLSDDGRRLFFESSDALMVGDTNAKRDVYQWEAAGSGGCDAADATFSKQDEGCIDLISSGQSARVSEFIDASPSGKDVFFATLSSLLPQDYGLVDIYDARVGGGFPPPTPEPQGCEGEACQSPPTPRQAPTPSSLLTGGSRQALGCRKGKHAVMRKGKRRCVPRHKRGHKHQGRRGAKR